jgi:hypothetical protein
MTKLAPNSVVSVGLDKKKRVWTVAGERPS